MYIFCDAVICPGYLDKAKAHVTIFLEISYPVT